MKYLKLTCAVTLVFLLCGFSSRENKPIQINVEKKIEIPTWYHEGLHFDGKYIWVTNGLKGKIWVVDRDSGKVIKEVAPAGTFTEAITSKGNGVYIVTDWDAENIYTAHVENNMMSTERKISTSPAHPTGTVWSGKNLFVITWTRSLAGTRFHLLKMDGKFNILKNYEIKEIQEPCQITYDGKNLWISSWFDRRVYKMDPDTFDILGYFNSPTKKTTGVAWDGNYLWVTGTYSDLYKIELQD